MAYFLLIIGFLLLIKGADFFVDGSSQLAAYMRVPTVIIGLTIVALGTSAPEAAVSIAAGIKGSSSLAISNVVGSNLFNTLVVIGVCALIKPFKIDKQILRRDLPVNMAVTILLFFLVRNHVLSRTDGLILLVLIIIYLTVMVKAALSSKDEEARIEHDPHVEIESHRPRLSLGKCVISIIGGLAAVIIGGDVVVDSATAIALQLGMSETLVGLTIVAIGTSLPELVTSVVASRKGDSGLALGNAVGSNLFNIMFILGASSAINPIPTTYENIVDVFVLICIAVITFIVTRIGENFGRGKGAMFVAIYAAYTAYIIMR